MENIFDVIKDYATDPLFWILYVVFSIVGAVIAYIFMTKKKIPRNIKGVKVVRVIIAILFGLTFIGGLFVALIAVFGGVLKWDKKKTYSIASLIVVLVLTALGIFTATTDTVQYENCTAAWNDGQANIVEGDPEYASHLDGDKDGVACESSKAPEEIKEKAYTEGCAALKEEGKTDIPSDSEDYKTLLDPNENGIACEADEGMDE